MSGRSFDLIALGECMVELSGDEPLGTATVLRRSYGGDVLNALVTAARLGSKTGFITRVGHDPFGPALLNAWRAEGIDTAHAHLVEGENGVYFISLGEDGEREFTYRRAGSAASGLAPELLDPAYLRSGKALLLSGITQAVSGTAQAATLEAARMARDAGVLVAYDPNYRPRLWAQRGGEAAARAAFQELTSWVDVLLPSFPDDLAFLTPAQLSLEEALRTLATFTPLVALKAGARGALLYVDGRIERAPAASPPRILDSTGAGDAWNGAFLHGLVHGGPASGAAELANRVAARTLAYPGAIAPRVPQPNQELV